MTDADLSFSDRLDEEMRALLDGVVNSALAPAETQRLSQRLNDESEVRLPALMYLDLHACLQRQWRGVGTTSSSDSTNAVHGWWLEEQEWAAFNQEAAREEEIKPALRPPAPPEEPTLMAALTAIIKLKAKQALSELHQSWNWIKRPRRGWAEGAVGLVLVALVIVLVFQPVPPPPPVLAEFASGVNVKWGIAAPHVVLGDEMSAGRYSLKEGVAELRFSSGAVAVFEGPCKFELLAADEVALWNGKVFVNVGEETERFVVETPSGTIVDLGTAFGVYAREDGSVETVVEEGRVTVAGHSAPEAQPLLVEAGFRSSIDAAGRVPEKAIAVAEYEYWDFRRRVSIEVELAELITRTMGVDAKGCGINPATGEVLNWTAALDGGARVDFTRSGAEGYQQVQSLPFVDGVFVPNDGAGAQISSSGLQFSGFPSASHQGTWNDIWIGQQPPLPEGWTRDQKVYLRRLQQITSSQLAIFMPSPKGLTLDLGALNEMYPGLEASRFRAAVMNTTAAHESRKLVADFWALVDGEVVAVRHDLTVQQGVVSLEFDLPPGSRFLTLMSTVGSDNRALHDRIVLTKAAIDMAPRLTLQQQ